MNGLSHRSWHGYCSQAAWLGADGGLARYRLTLVPFLSFLALRRDAYIFQNKDALVIITELLAEWQLSATESGIMGGFVACRIFRYGRLDAAVA